MSWSPLRDDFDLPQVDQDVIEVLSERIDDAASRGNHQDTCACQEGIEVCGRGWLISGAPSEYVIAWLLKEGLVGVEQIREAAKS
jgi:hypothetical protein